jgi:hypothetical protein
MSLAARRGLRGDFESNAQEGTMTRPTVTEITRREPLAHDTFIDDLRPVRGADPQVETLKEPPR